MLGTVALMARADCEREFDQYAGGSGYRNRRSTARTSHSGTGLYSLDLPAAFAFAHRAFAAAAIRARAAALMRRRGLEPIVDWEPSLELPVDPRSLAQRARAAAAMRARPATLICRRPDLGGNG